jgi:hypothetical protein
VTVSLDELWLATLQKLAAHVAHDLKGALNSASVNLEVVRSRSERESTTGAGVHRYAVNAAEQLTIVIRATGALLSLVRGTRGPAEVSMVTKQVASLLNDMGSAAGGRFEVSVEGGMTAETSAPLNAVRLAVAECLLANGESGAVLVRVSAVPAPRIQVRPGAPPALEPAVAGALSTAGIRIETDGHGISISLPGPPELPH